MIAKLKNLAIIGLVIAVLILLTRECSGKDVSPPGMDDYLEKMRAENEAERRRRGKPKRDWDAIRRERGTA